MAHTETIPMTAEHALRILEAVHEPEPGLAADELTAEAAARVRVAVDRALESAWAEVRALAAAEAASSSATVKPRRSFAEWTRTAILAQLTSWRERLGGELQLAHRKLTELSDDELRTLLGDLEDAAERNAR